MKYLKTLPGSHFAWDLCSLQRRTDGNIAEVLDQNICLANTVDYNLLWKIAGSFQLPGNRKKIICCT